MYYQYFGLTENPFSISPDPRYLYLSVQHKEALAHLLYGTEQWGGFIQLTGEVGTGKTMLTRVLLERLPAEVDLALLFNPRQTPVEFVRSICDELHIVYPADSKHSLKDLVDGLNRFLLENYSKGRRTVVMIDEAQNLDVDVLEQIRLLTNLETTKTKLLMMILVGQPELRLLLARKELRQLAQRITARYHLMPLPLNQTQEYIRHRLKIAGCADDLFTRQAVEVIQKFSLGVPRLINVICDRALLGAFSLEKKKVDGDIAQKAAREVAGEMALEVTEQTRRYWLPVIAAMAGGVLLSALAFYFLHSPATAPIALKTESKADAPDAAGVSQSTAAPSLPAAAQTLAGGALAGTQAVAVNPVAPAAPTFEELLSNENLASDTATAFKMLFKLWNEDYAKLSGSSGCEKAVESNLSCMFTKGNWNNLRELNRPAIIELVDSVGYRHHLVVSGLQDGRLKILLPDGERSFPTSEVDPFWYGDMLLIWSRPPFDDDVIKPGTDGAAAEWLAQTLDRLEGLPEVPHNNQVVDDKLLQRVKKFQREHRLLADGVVGPQTLIRLQTSLGEENEPTLSGDANAQQNGSL